MLREFKLPDLGEGLTESEIVAWRVAAGDTVALNQIIADVETAKAVVELPSPVDGVVKTLHAEAGDTVDVGAVIVTFDIGGDAAGSEADAAAAGTGDSGGAPAAADPASPAAATAPTEATEPDVADAPEPNLVGYGAGPDRKGRPVRRARVGQHGAHAAVSTASAPPVERPRSTPPVRHLAEQLGVDLTRITGTGPDGLITRDDVQAASGQAVETGHGTHSAVERAPEPLGVTPATANSALERRIPIKGVRKFTAAAMVQSAFTAPHATCFLTVDVTPTLELLERLSDRRDLAGTRVTLLALIARAFVIALRAHPELNSRWDEANQEIVQFGYVNLGIAAATDRGLVVPNIRNAHAMTLLDLADALGELTQEARAGKTPPERMSGGTITISNLGVFGVDAGTPILNPGEAAILALGAAQNRPWEFHGELALRRVMTLSLSFDHRLVDGEQAARFLADLGGLLGDPALAMLRDGGVGPLPLT